MITHESCPLMNSASFSQISSIHLPESQKPIPFKIQKLNVNVDVGNLFTFKHQKPKHYISNPFWPLDFRENHIDIGFRSANNLSPIPPLWLTSVKRKCDIVIF